MATPEGPQDATPAPQPEPVRTLTWHKLAAWAAWAIPVIFILVMVASMEFIPFFMPSIVVFGAVGFWVSRGGRAAGIVLAVLAVIFIIINLPFIKVSLGVPASPFDFIPTVWLLLAAITALGAGIMVFRRAGPAAAARTFQRVAAGLAVIAVIISVVATATYDNAAPEEGDFELRAEDIEFSPPDVQVKAGKVSIFVTNLDPTLHTFTVDELDVDLDIPADSEARVEFQAEPGEYEFYCVPHEQDMKGTLTVQ